MIGATWAEVKELVEMDGMALSTFHLRNSKTLCKSSQLLWQLGYKTPQLTDFKQTGEEPHDFS